MKTYTITIKGCDDKTIFDMELSDDEVNLVQRISEKTKETSEYSCMPVLRIKETSSDGGGE